MCGLTICRARQGHPLCKAIHHLDAGSQYISVHFTEILMLADMVPSIGTAGDALDCPLVGVDGDHSPGAEVDAVAVI
jgi:hypothetical protein